MPTLNLNPENNLSLVAQPLKPMPLRRSTKVNAKPSKKDFTRWSRFRQGIDPQDIALEDQADVVKVQASIQNVLSYLQQASLEVVTAEVHNIVLDTLPDVSRILSEFASATKTRTKKVKERRLITVGGKEIETEVDVDVEVVEIDYTIR